MQLVVPWADQSAAVLGMSAVVTRTASATPAQKVRAKASTARSGRVTVVMVRVASPSYAKKVLLLVDRRQVMATGPRWGVT